MRKTKIGIIGCGGIAGSHIQGYLSNPDVSLASFCDVIEAKASSRVSEFGGRGYSDYRSMLEKEKLDGISICTPPSHHQQIAIEAMKKGVNVFCEKPLATTAAGAASMVEAAKNSKVLLMTAFKFRFFKQVQEAKRLIEEGKIGKVLMFRNMFGGFADMRETWFSKKSIAGGGVLLDNGVHAIDLCRFLLGEVKNVSACLNTFVQKIEVEDTARILMEMKDGAMASVDLSWSIPVPSEFYVEIYGTEGSIMLGGASRYHLRRPEGWVEIKSDEAQLPAFIREVNHFVKCIRGEEEPIVSGLDGLKSMEVIEAAYKSVEEKVWVDLTKLRRKR